MFVASVFAVCKDLFSHFVLCLLWKKNPECDMEFSQIILTAVKINQTFCVLNSAPAPSVDDLNGSWQRVMEKKT
jgi:hypothetical protein